MSVIDVPDKLPETLRPRVLLTALLLGLLAILGRLWYLQIAHGPELAEKSLANERRLIRRVPPRGVIQDRKGRVLATNRHQIVVTVVLDEAQKSRDTLPGLARLLDITPEELSARIEAGRVSPFDPIRVAEDVPIEVATRVEEQRANMPGVYIGPEPVRSYPDGPLCGHILGQMGQIRKQDLPKRRAEGYLPGDHCGSLGLESEYDPLLRGTNGGREIVVDARGRVRADVSNHEPVPGATLTLCLDKDLQKIAYEELAAWAAKGKPGAAVALDPQTGGVLALASVPSYDPNEFVKGISKQNWQRLATNPLHPQVNRAVGGGGYAPGSTFKVVTATAALETGVATEGTTEYCSGRMMLGHWAKHCHKLSGHGSLDMVGALAKSCDVYFYHMGMALGPDRLAAYARRYGLGTVQGIDLPKVEKPGLVPDTAWKRRARHEDWMGGEKADYGIGQAMLRCTPLQMCNIAAAIGNGGTLYRPQLVETITTWNAAGQAHVAHRLKPEVVRRLNVSPAHLATVVHGMCEVMQPGGTASTQGLPGIEVAGKTGTAQMIDHHELINNAWFIGFAPAEHPRIAVCVFIQGGGHGGVSAGPIARKMMARFFGIKLNGASEENSTD